MNDSKINNSLPLIFSVPKVSVVTVVYNGVGEIRRTIDSVLRQNFSSFEYIVIDGNSTDGTQAVVQSYGKAINQFVSESDNGVYDAMNKGVRIARGEFLLFMNSGDVFSDENSLSCLVAQISAGDREKVIFGGWSVLMRCGKIDKHTPDLVRGIFNHQATLYAKSIHSWHGDYFVIAGVTTADFLFFRTLQATRRVDFHVVNQPVAKISPYGLSSGLQTYLQRVLVDMLCGYEGRYLGVLKILIHPAYNRIKRFFGR